GTLSSGDRSARFTGFAASSGSRQVVLVSTCLSYIHACGTCISVFLEILRRLDGWASGKDAEDRAAGMRGLKACRIRLLGQWALFEQDLPLTLMATQDLDVKANYEWAVEQKFHELAREHQLSVDPDGQKVWMPKGTQYTKVYAGQFVTGEVAEADYVLISKALKAPEKNKTLIAEFLAIGASERFLSLAREHGLDLEQFL